jgi:hypothetical protein
MGKADLLSTYRKKWAQNEEINFPLLRALPFGN